jgi:protein-tyrosine kinase
VGVVDQAVKRLEAMERAGVQMPWRSADAADDRSATQEEGPAQARQPQLHQLAPLQSAFGAERAIQPGPVASVALPSADLDANSPSAVQSLLDKPGAAPTKRPVAKRVEIDLARLASLGYITPLSQQRSVIAEEFRVIKRPLLMNARVESEESVVRGNVIMLTSTLPGEGKTFSSINLAMSIAGEHGKTVLLIEADSARPAVLDRLGIPRANGLFDVLADDTVGLADVILQTNVDGLSVLPVGTPSPRSTELLASDSMRRLIERLAQEDPDRIVIFDGPPLLPSVEGRELAAHAGQVVMVVEFGKTSRAKLAQAMAMLDRCPVVMTLLNKSQAGNASASYGYYAY